MKLLDHYIIKVETVWETGMVGNIQTQWGQRYPDQERDRYERKRLHGTVVSTPAGFTLNNHIFQDPGFPNPRLHVGHDLIQSKINEGFEEYHNWERFYNLATNDHIEYDTLADYPCDAKVGERVYFHPQVTEPENQMAPLLFKCRTDELICVADPIRMQGGYILVEPIETQNEVAGIILESTTELQRGIIRHGGSGDILFTNYADWLYEVNGVKYYAMRQDDVMQIK